MESILNKTRVKILTLGNQKVGKTSLINYFVSKKFKYNTQTTVGNSSNLEDRKIDGIDVSIEIHDTAGQERFRSIPSRLIQSVDGILLIFDISDDKSFNDIQVWLKSISDNVSENKMPVLYLIANKVDLIDKKYVDLNCAKKLADKQNMKYFEASAKEGINVETIFLNMAKDIMKNQEKTNKEYTISLSKPNQRKTKDKNCDC